MKSAPSEIAAAGPFFLTYGQKRSIIALSELETGRWWVDNRLLTCSHFAVLPDFTSDGGKWYLRDALAPHFVDYLQRGWIVMDSGRARISGALASLDEAALAGVAHIALFKQVPGTWRGLSFGPTALYGGLAGDRYWPPADWAGIKKWIQGDLASAWLEPIEYLYATVEPPENPADEAWCREWLGVHYHGGTKDASKAAYNHWAVAYGKVGW